MPKQLLFISLFLWPFLSQSQVITGVITNYEQKAVPFATIYIEELQTGTSANQEGKYEVHVNPGKYTLSYRSMGYTPQTKTIEVSNENVVLNVELQMQSYILAGVTVRADAEDPAYAIMRKAIARAPGFINQAKSYDSEVYIKGSIKLEKIPKLLQKQMDINGERPEVGETYVNESLNRISFKAPDSYVQEVISVNNSFPMGDNDVPVIELISGSIYESQDDFYISPFAPNAFAHYKFEYEGLLQDGAWFIDKIKVIPKRKSQLLMEGYVYIVEDLWCMYSYDIVLRPQFLELKMKQHYAPVKGNSYFPVNLFVEAKFSVMGIKGGGNYTTTIKYKNVVLNPQFNQNKVTQAITYNPTDTTAYEEPKVDPKIVEVDKKLEELTNKNELTNREMIQMQKLMSKKASILKESVRENPLEIKSDYKQIVNKDALVRDSMYWDSVRPVPASEDEKISYQKVEEKQQKEDSTSGFVKVLKTIAFGNYEWARSDTFNFFYPGLLSTRNVGFNPVDGLQLKQHCKIYINIDSAKILQMKTWGGYAWHRQQFFGKTNIWYKYDFIRDAWFELNAEWMAEDFNSKDGYGTPEQLNALYNIFSKENYKKLYDHKYFRLRHRNELANGFNMIAGAKYQLSDTLSNNTNFSIVYPDSLYEANVPVNNELRAENLNPAKTALIFAQFEYTPKNYYKIDNGRKRYLGSKWPTFQFSHEYALPLKDHSSFHHSQVGLRQEIDFYGISSIRYQAKAGVFYAKDKVHFSDFMHFKTIEEPFTTRKLRDGFFLLNNYEYSTSNSYLQANFQYTTQFLLLKRLPWISKKYWNENLYANVLTVDGHKPYFEGGYSMGQIFFAGEIGVYAGFKGSEFHGVGVRAAFEF